MNRTPDNRATSGRAAAISVSDVPGGLRFRQVFERLPVGIAVTGPDRAIRHANPAYLAMIGETAESLAAGTIRWSEKLLASEFAAADDRALRQVAERGYCDPYVREYGPEPGRRVPVRVTIVALASGPRTEFVAFALDITNEQAASTRFARIFDSGMVGVVLGDRTGKFAEVNDAFLRTIGYSREEFEAGPPDWRAMTPDECMAVEDAALVQVAQRGYSDPYQKAYRLRDGSRAEVEIAVAALDPRKPDGELIALVSDIGGRKAVEAELRARTRQQDLLVEVAQRLLESTDPDGDVLPWLFERLRADWGVDGCFAYVAEASAMRLGFAGGIPEEAAPGLATLAYGQALCGSVAADRRSLHVGDLQDSDDPRVQLVREFGARAYACEPLLARGQMFGTFSIFSCREDAFDAGRLGMLAQVAGLLATARQRIAAERALVASEERLRLALDAAQGGVWEWDAVADCSRLSPDVRPLFGLPPGEEEAFPADILRTLIQPEDYGAVMEEVGRAVAAGSNFSVTFRNAAAPGRQRWLEMVGRPDRDEQGRLVRLVGLVFDITERMEAREREQMLMREIDHRARNLLAVVQSVVQLTRADSAEDFARAVNGRVHALAKVHSLLSVSSWRGAGLHALVAAELEPFDGKPEDADGARAVLSGDPVWLVPAAAQAVAMVLHELATNAAKYGALSRRYGRVEIGWWRSADGRLELDWREKGGPPVDPPARRGFGSTMIAAALRQQLRGRVEMDWARDGLRARISLPAEHLLPAEAGLELAD